MKDMHANGAILVQQHLYVFKSQLHRNYPAIRIGLAKGGGIPKGVALSSLTFHGLLFRSMHDLLCKTMYITSYRTGGCAMQILLAYPLGGPHGIQTKITIFLTKKLSLTLL